jgi:hypothetical protein
LTVASVAPRLIDRGDLVAALDRAAARKVTVISAPAGSGKTSLLRAWAGRPGQPRRLAVLQVQRDQQDAQQFWLALLGAVRQATGADGGAEPPTATPDFNAPAMVDRVLSELAEARGGITLVIDDLHELTSPEALAQLTRLLTDLPAHVHVILTTRHDLRLGLHQLRLAGELAEIRAADLRFSEQETRELLDAADVTLSAAGAALLYQRAEGWAAGLVRVMGDLTQGRLDEAAAHLAVAEAYAETAPPDRRRRLGVAVASLQLALARRRGDLAGVIEQARFLASPVTGQSDEDIALGTDLRAVTLMNLGTAEAWALGLPDAERHLREGAVLAREIGRPYLEVACLARLGFASVGLHSFATIQRRCREAIALAERHGWGTEPVIAPALIMLAGMMVWTGEFDEAERWLRRAAPALQTDRAGSQAARAHGKRLAAGRPRPAPRGTPRVQRGQAPAIADGGIARARQPDDRLTAGHPSPCRAA